MRFLLAAMLIAAASGAATAAPIVIDTATFNGRTYYLLSTSNWTDAQAKAVTLGGYLTTINNAAENTFLYNKWSGGGGNNRGLWIGLNDAAVEGNFVWVNGEPVLYTNWDPGEPNNAGGEDYAYIRPFAAGRWNDVSDNSGYDGDKFGVVEVNTIPEPVSCLVFGGLLAAGGLAARRRMKVTA